jgi:uncharacterized protein YjdB
MRIIVKALLLLVFWATIAQIGYSNHNQFVDNQSGNDSIKFEFDTIYLEAIGKKYQRGTNVTVYQTMADGGGNTSIRNVVEESLDWKTQGYFQRNRDLGQVFIPKKDTRLKSIVLRTGPAESAVLHNTPGAKVFIQFFEIVGEPVINDNGTPKGTNATHGFSTNHRCDDFIDGISYKSTPTIYTGVFPTNIPNTKDFNGNTLGDEGRLYYFRCSFEEPILFLANHRYGFIMGFCETGDGYGITLANANRASLSDVPSLNDKNTPYKGGWSFRREGDGTLPPTMIPGINPPTSDSMVQKLKSESLFGTGNGRFTLSPTSDGFPDVDTYRAYEFYIEEESVKVSRVSLNHDSLKLVVGETFQLSATVLPENATNKKIYWLSASPKVSSVDPTGKIKALLAGVAAITVFTDDGTLNSTCIITVKEDLTAKSGMTNSRSEIKTYPNPVSGGTLLISSVKSTILRAGLVSPNGRHISNFNINTNEYSFDVRFLPKGMYVLQVTTPEETSCHKVIIM